MTQRKLVTKFLWMGALLIGTFVLFRFGAPKESWESRTRRESIQALGIITSTNQLQDAVGNGGVVLMLTNGSWIAIRTIAEFEPDREVTVARDSAGKWFASERKFSGSLTVYPHHKAAPKTGEVVATTSAALLLEKAEVAPDLESAWETLTSGLGFTPFSAP